MNNYFQDKMGPARMPINQNDLQRGQQQQYQPDPPDPTDPKEKRKKYGRLWSALGYSNDSIPASSTSYYQKFLNESEYVDDFTRTTADVDGYDWNPDYLKKVFEESKGKMFEQQQSNYPVRVVDTVDLYSERDGKWGNHSSLVFEKMDWDDEKGWYGTGEYSAAYGYPKAFMEDAREWDISPKEFKRAKAARRAEASRRNQ